jgi:hypothetical protein
MNTLELSKLIGKRAVLSSDKLSFAVHIVDAKTSYGNLRYLVTPASGSGQVWVDSNRVQLDETKESEL